MNNKIPANAYLIIIGSMKSGTTTLFNYLESHPEICPAITKEPEFFSRYQEHGIDIKNYYDLFKFDSHIHKYALEASTGYTKYPYEFNVPERMKDYGINPKFIYIVRNPYDRIVSQFNHVYKDDKTYSYRDMFTHLIDNSKYYTQISRYNRVFSKENLIVIDFDELKNNPKIVLKTIYEFTGLKGEFLPNTFMNFNKTTGDPKKSRILQKKIDEKLYYFPSFIRLILKKTIRMYYFSKGLKLTDIQKKEIFHELKQDMKNLKIEYDFEIEKWGFY